ncbi:MAG: helix-hairpin-helix domain-containing protein [Anaerolineae bacterium]|nr:helix-hairpin-helix domain-containing protein [Anaerolineae bacterium]
MNEGRGTLLAFVLLVIAISGGLILLVLTRPVPVQITIIPPLPTATLEATFTPSPVTIYITGAVKTPPVDTITLPAGSRVEDAISLAGGAADNADLTKVNLAAVLRDGDQVHVPTLGETVAIATPNTGGIIFINSATLEELETLPDVGPALAQRIIDYRTANGRINNFEDLDTIEGVGPAMIEGLQELVSFE